MFRRPLRRFVSFALVVTLAFLAVPAHALPFLRKGDLETPRVPQIEREAIGFFTFLFRLFGKSRGGMDPNGTTEPGPTGSE
jgi:hypothetical protein